MTFNHMRALISNLLTNIMHTWARQPAPAKFQLLADIEIPLAMSRRMRCNMLSHSHDVGCNLVSPTLLFVLLLLFVREKSKYQKSTDCFSKAKSSTFQCFFHAFLYFPILLQALYKNKKNCTLFFGCNISLVEPTIFEMNSPYRILF